MSTPIITDNRQKQATKNERLPAWQQLLADRGILDTALHAGWQSSNNGWDYPIHNLDGQIVTRRWKAYPDTNSQKYRWLPNKPAGADYYFGVLITVLQAAIANANSTLYIANGEPAVLTFIAAGLLNVLSWFGETSIPKNLVETLEFLQIKKIIYIPDNDDAGLNSARKLQKLLAPTDIELILLDWGDHVDHKGDANDLWIQVNFNPQHFQDVVGSLQPLTPPVEAPRNTINEVFRPSSPLITSTDDYDQAVQNTIQALMRTLDVDSFKGNGWSKNFQCVLPNHKDRRPSAGIHQESGVYKCFACGITLSPRDLAEHLGIPWPQRQGQIAPRRSHQPTPPIESELQGWWPTDIPDGAISFILNFLPNSAASILYWLNRAFNTDQLDPRCFTIKEAAAIIKVSPRTLAQTITGTDIRPGLEKTFLRKLAIEDQQEDLSPLFAKRITKGRKAELYCLQPLAEIEPILLSYARPRLMERYHKDVIAQPTHRMATDLELESEMLEQWDAALRPAYAAQDYRQEQAVAQVERQMLHWRQRLRDPHNSPFPSGFPAQTSADFRAAFFRALVIADPDKPRSRAQLSILLGTSTSNLDAIYKRAGLQPELQEEWVPLRENVSPVQALAPPSRGVALSIRATDPNGTTHHCSYFADERNDFATQQVAAGAKLALRVRTASKQVVVADEPLPSKPKSAPMKTSTSPVTTPLEPTPPRHYGPTHDPVWLYAQLVLALEAVTPYRVRDGVLWQGVTEEALITAPSAQMLLALVLGKSPPTPDQHELTWFITSQLGGVPKERLFD